MDPANAPAPKTNPFTPTEDAEAAQNTLNPRGDAQFAQLLLTQVMQGADLFSLAKGVGNEGKEKEREKGKKERNESRERSRHRDKERDRDRERDREKDREAIKKKKEDVVCSYGREPLHDRSLVRERTSRRPQTATVPAGATRAVVQDVVLRSAEPSAVPRTASSVGAARRGRRRESLVVTRTDTAKTRARTEKRTGRRRSGGGLLGLVRRARRMAVEGPGIGTPGSERGTERGRRILASLRRKIELLISPAESKRRNKFIHSYRYSHIAA